LARRSAGTCDIELHYVRTVEEVMDIALEPRADAPTPMALGEGVVR
jgi:hypothetical protein